MSNHLEKFIQDHREQFDDEVPDPKILERLHERMRPPEQRENAKVVSINFRKLLSAAAAVILVIAVGTFYLLNRKKPAPVQVAISNHLPERITDTPVTVHAARQIKPDQQIAKADPKNDIVPDHKKTTDVMTDDFPEEMYHYTKLVEIKHRELKRLEKDEPLLYKQFAGDVNKLDSVYLSLKTQLPKNSNREQVIEAMIENLQLQIGLLNRQLNIIKQINHSKKSAYDNAYKSV